MDSTLLECVERVLSTGGIDQRTTEGASSDYLTPFSAEEQFQKVNLQMIKEELHKIKYIESILNKDKPKQSFVFPEIT